MPTRGQMERTLSQRVQALYRAELGHQPSKVQCNIADGKVIILLEDSITKPEKVLLENGQEELAEQVREDLDKAFTPQLTALIQEVVGVKVIDLLTDATFDTGRSGTIAVLETSPQYRDSHRHRFKDENDGADGDK